MIDLLAQVPVAQFEQAAHQVFEHALFVGVQIGCARQKVVGHIHHWQVKMVEDEVGWLSQVLIDRILEQAQDDLVVCVLEILRRQARQSRLQQMAIYLKGGSDQKQRRCSKTYPRRISLTKQFYLLLKMKELCLVIALAERSIWITQIPIHTNWLNQGTS